MIHGQLLLYRRQFAFSNLHSKRGSLNNAYCIATVSMCQSLIESDICMAFQNFNSSCCPLENMSALSIRLGDCKITGNPLLNMPEVQNCLNLE